MFVASQSIVAQRVRAYLWLMSKLALVFTLLLFAGASSAGAVEKGAFRGNLDQLAAQNSDFRRVLYTGEHLQIVAMALPRAEEIGEEVHTVDQCFFIVQGKGEGVLAGKATSLGERDSLCVPAGTRHNLRNRGDGPLKLYTIYAPPQHPAGTVHHTKADAERAEKKPAK